MVLWLFPKMENCVWTAQTNYFAACEKERQGERERIK